MFELAKTDSGYSSVPTILAAFVGSGTGFNAGGPSGQLLADSAGNLFGTTSTGGANGGGMVFELAKTGTGSTGYSAPTSLVSFGGNSAGTNGGGLPAV